MFMKRAPVVHNVIEDLYFLTCTKPRGNTSVIRVTNSRYDIRSRYLVYYHLGIQLSNVLVSSFKTIMFDRLMSI